MKWWKDGCELCFRPYLYLYKVGVGDVNRGLCEYMYLIKYRGLGFIC